MSHTFSSKLVACRHDKGVTQKEAAKALGITPALLSHYENGIRECKIDMLPKFSEYYGVTADYLLGCSESRHGAGEMFDMNYAEGDDTISPKTIIRSVIGLSGINDAEQKNDKYFCDFFSLCIKKFVDASGGNTDVRSRFINQAIDGLDTGKKGARNIRTGIPACAETALENADLVIDTALAGIIGGK